MSAEKEFSLSLKGSILHLVKKRRLFILIGVIAFVVSSVVSFLITPMYKSTVIMMPTKSISVSLSSTLSTPSKEGMANFGEEEEVEQLLQVLNTRELFELVNKRFDLVTRYGFYKNKGKEMDYTYDAFRGNFRFKKTEFMGLQLDVFDNDPQMAATMADYTTYLIDSLVIDQKREKAQKVLEATQIGLDAYLADVQKTQDSLTVLRSLGVQDYESQAERFNQALATAIANGNQAAVNRLEKRMKVMAELGSSYTFLQDLLHFQSERISVMQTRLAEAKVELEQKIPVKYLIQKADTPQLKTYPKRSVLVIVSTLAALFMAFVVSLIFESVKKGYWNE